MDKHLKEILNNKLSGLPVEEAVPGFRKELLWEQLSDRLQPQQRKLIPLRKSLLYAAAAVLTGIIAGGGLVRYLGRNDRPGATIGHSIVHSFAPVNDTGIQAGATAAEPHGAASEAQKDAYPLHPKRAALQPTIAAARLDTFALNQETAELKPLVAQREQPEPAMQDNSLVREAARPEAARARHLLDLESEDRTVLVDQSAPARSVRSFSVYISPSRLPEGRDESAPGSILDALIH